jgi:hypothetical protein
MRMLFLILGIAWFALFEYVRGRPARRETPNPWLYWIGLAGLFFFLWLAWST